MSKLTYGHFSTVWFLRYSKLYRILPYHTGSPMSCRFNTVSVWWSDTHVHRDHVFSSWAAGGSFGACRTPVDYNVRRCVSKLTVSSYIYPDLLMASYNGTRVLIRSTHGQLASALPGT